MYTYLLFFRYLPHKYVSFDFNGLCPCPTERSGILGHWRINDGTMLCSQILSGNWNLCQRKTGNCLQFFGHFGGFLAIFLNI